MTYREHMREEYKNNLSWCRPELIKYDGKSVIIALNEGDIVGLLIGGEDVTAENPTSSFKKMADYLGLEGVEDMSDVYYYETDGEKVVETEEWGCSKCPWFNICPAMDERYGDGYDDTDDDE